MTTTRTSEPGPADAAPATVDDVRMALLDALADLGIGGADVVPDARLSADLELDSTELVQVALELTRRFGVRVKLSAKDDLTVAHVCALVAELTSGPHTGASEEPA